MKMKKLTFLMVLAGMMALLATGASAAVGKIGTIDLDQVFEAHPKTVASAAALKEKEEDAKAEAEALVERQKKLQAQVEEARAAAKSPLLSEEARKEKRAAADAAETEYSAFMVSARRQTETKLRALREEVLEMRGQIVDEMMTELAAFAEQEGYALILDRSGLTMNNVPVIVYAKDALDVTKAFIEFIQSDRPAAPEGATAAGTSAVAAE